MWVLTQFFSKKITCTSCPDMSEPIPRVILGKHNLDVKPSDSLQLYIGLHAVARDSTRLFPGVPSCILLYFSCILSFPGCVRRALLQGQCGMIFNSNSNENRCNCNHKPLARCIIVFAFFLCGYSFFCYVIKEKPQNFVWRLCTRAKLVVIFDFLIRKLCRVL